MPTNKPERKLLGEIPHPHSFQPRNVAEFRTQWKEDMAQWSHVVRESGILNRLFSLLDEEEVCPECAVDILLYAAGAMKMRTFGKTVVIEGCEEATFVLGASVGIAMRLLDAHHVTNHVLAQAGLPTKAFESKELAKLVDDMGLQWPGNRK